MRMRSIGWVVLLGAFVVCGPTLLAQVLPAPGTVSGPSAGTPAGEWSWGIVWAFFSTSGLEWLKRHPKVQVLSEDTGRRLQRLWGLLVAAATALGIHVAFDGEAGTLVISGLVLSSVVTAAGEIARQFVANEVMYRVVIKPYGKPTGA